MFAYISYAEMRNWVYSTQVAPVMTAAAPSIGEQRADAAAGSSYRSSNFPMAASLAPVPAGYQADAAARSACGAMHTPAITALLGGRRVKSCAPGDVAGAQDIWSCKDPGAGRHCGGPLGNDDVSRRHGLGGGISAQVRGGDGCSRGLAPSGPWFKASEDGL